MFISRRRMLAGTAASAAMLAGKDALAAPPLAPQPRYRDGNPATRSNAWLEVDTGGFASNIEELRRQIGDLRKVCVVVKADAYGHGLDLLMPTILRHRIPWLGVASTDEARVVRSHGFRGRILRLRVATADEVEDGMPYRVEEMIGGLEVAENAARIAKRRGSILPIHLAINSMGMSREGLDLRLEANRADATRLLALPGLRLAGIMDHSPVNTVEEHRTGGRRFMADAEWVLGTAGVARDAVLLHCANSFGSLNVPENRLDLMRVGRALYGHGGAFTGFKFFSTFKARIASIGVYPAGSTVSYERSYTLKRESRLANIPIGYSDGYRRVFSRTDRQAAEGVRTAEVLVHGRRAPVVGLVTMNVMVVDVTDIPAPVRAGDEVVLFGQQGNESIPIDELMGIAGTNPPDLYTLWGNSLPKLRI